MPCPLHQRHRWHLPSDRYSVHTLAADPRFGYGLFVPVTAAGSQAAPGLLVAVHDTRRKFLQCLDGFAAFGQARGLVVLAPYFPPYVQDDSRDGYKFLIEPGIRYDQLLNAMVEEATAATGCRADRFFLHGYSGGAQFAHRYGLLHPRRVWAASIAAPGAVTLPDDELDWWAGVGNVQRLFGLTLEPAAWRGSALQVVVGEHDVQTAGLRAQPGSRLWPLPEAPSASNRVDRAMALAQWLRSAGAQVEFSQMPGIDHRTGPKPAMAWAQRFFAQQLEPPGQIKG